MMVKPKLTWDEDRVRSIPSSLEDGLFIDCEAVSPRSAEGRSVTVWIPPERVDAFLLTLRDDAMARRR